MKLLCIVLITTSALSACAKKQMDKPASKPPTAIVKTVPDSNKLSYLALGDSYTIGESVAQAQSYPYQLAAQMTASNHPVTDPKIIAVTGWTTDNLINAIASAGIDGNKYNIVTLLIGVNDQYQGLSQTNYSVKFQQVLNTAIEFAGGNKKHVYVLSIPDYGVTPFAGGDDSKIGPEIDEFNAINKAISDKAGVNYINITPISKQAATDLTLLAPDGLHPSGKMYTLWIAELLPQVITNAD